MLSSSQTQNHTTSETSKQSRALTGSVTKLLDNFGFIDDSVFFQLSVVKGGDVQVGDKVYCECSYSEHLPFKWNATKVHLVQSNNRSSSSSSQSSQTQSQSNASQVASTYLQHRLQQQQQQQPREEANNPMAGININPSHNYYSNQSVANQSSFVPQMDFVKTQQAVAAAQQLASYYGRNDNQNNFSQLQYTSTPGSAFVSSSLPFAQQIQANILPAQTRHAPQNSYKSSGSRWERDERSGRTDDRFRNRDNDRSRFGENVRKRHDEREIKSLEKDRNSIGRDEFGRDLRRDRDRDRDRDRERDKDKERERERLSERERRSKRSESPNSVTSQNQSTRVAQRRRYEPVNIPKLAILKNPLNVYDIKQRYSANLHVPSDLKEVVVNSQFSLNISDIPKPITFRVVDIKNENKRKDSPKKTESNKDVKKMDSKDENDSKQEATAMEVEDSNNKTDGKDKASPGQPISLRSQHKYGVKVLIISLPSMNDIYDRIFGSDFDAISTGSKAYFLHFNKLLAFLVSRNANDGFSLIGGKFSPQLDGYISDTDEPNLIATAIRVVGEQTGMNLTKCSKWKLIATFVYNRDNSVDPLNPSLEFTRVYMPDVWSSLDSIYDELKTNKSITNDIENNESDLILNNDMIEKNSENSDDVIANDHKSQLISAHTNDLNDSSAGIQQTDSLAENCSTASSQQPSADISSAMDLSDSNVSESEGNNLRRNQESISNVATTTSDTTTIDLTSGTAISSSIEPQVVDSSSVDSSATVVPTPQKEIEDSSSNARKLDSDIQTRSVSGNDKETNVSSPSTKTAAQKSAPIPGDPSELQLLLSRINDMKVAELRAELEKRGTRIKANLKKADLVVKLKQVIEQLLEDEDVVSDEVKNDWWAQRIRSKESASNETEDKDSSQQNQSNNEEDVQKDVHKSSDNASNDNNDSNARLTIDDTNQQESQMSVDNQSDNQNKKDDQNVVSTDHNQRQEQSETAQTNDAQQKSPENESNKRKNDESQEIEPKKAKSGNESPPREIVPKKVVEGCVCVKGGENLTVITLHEALNHQRYDQFEMSIASELVRESLIHHFSHYILSTLVHNHRNPAVKEEKSSQDLKPTPLPVNYVHLSFAYFDSSHCGHILSEDLAKLLNNANFTLSRRAFNLLVNSEEKVVYRDLTEPKELLALKKANYNRSNVSSGNDSSNANQVKIIEKNGTVYDIEKLIEQSESNEKLKVRLAEELTANKDKIEQLNEYINELENRQKKMTVATEKQNDEICSLKREREIIKNKYDSLRKAVETSVSSFNEVLKVQSEENKI